MNGRFPSVLPTFGPSGEMLGPTGPDPHAKRFYGALVASCLLHGALVFMPYLGTGSAVSDFHAQGGKKPAPARALEVRMAVDGGAAADPANATVVAGTPESSATPKPAEEPTQPAADSIQGSGLLPIPAPAFYTAERLTKRPRPTSAPKLNVSETRTFFAPGKVVLKLWINELGNVITVDIEQSEVPDAVAATAKAAFAKLRFIPGEIDGRRVGAIMRIEVTYDEPTGQPK